jgi:hypothetical protein
MTGWRAKLADWQDRMAAMPRSERHALLVGAAVGRAVGLAVGWALG